MTASKDGGSAFPIPRCCAQPKCPCSSPGASLRDYFATHATLTQADLDYANRHYPNGVAAILAGIRYQYADAMLAERGKADPAWGAYERAAEALHAACKTLVATILAMNNDDAATREDFPELAKAEAAIKQAQATGVQCA